ncbi:break repair meiotic recombinase recruitment factor 1 [Sorex araneus]|uniref:break repair meiotic recombinase recruitment factor 1 n=1 Tax=Sorex araneus TaxID=42254 RepID=UPI002433B75D|nr:break repair meiotic recombinase recruitment factor 1 [Sorex araneus]
MNKRKKLHPSGVRTKSPKTPRLEDTDEVPPSSQLSQLPPHPPEEPDDPAVLSAQCSRADPELVAPSFPDEEEATSSTRPLQLPQKEPAATPPSQTSAGRFVPQFARPRKTTPRQVESEEELQTQAVCSEAQLEPTQAEGICPQHSSQSPGMEDPPPAAPPGTSPEWGSIPCASESQVSASRSCPPDGAAAESGPGLKDHLPSRDAGHCPDPGVMHGGGDTELPDHGTDPEPQSTATGPPEHSPGGPGRGVCQSSQSAPCTPSRPLVITDERTGLEEPEQRAIEGFGQNRQPDLEAPGEDQSGVLPLLEYCAPLPGETVTSRGEPGGEDETPYIIPPPTIQDLTVGTELSSHPASEAHTKGAHMQMPGALGDGVPPNLLPQPPGELCCSSQSSGCQLNPPAPQDVEDMPSCSPAGQREQPADPVEEADWGGSAALEFDFLLDSQIQDSLVAPDPPTPLKQLSQWSGLSPGQHAEEGHHVPALPRSQVAAPAHQATSVEDATDTVRGLVLELSNLNRLVMSTHRDLEACRRLRLRKGKPVTPGPRAPGGPSWRDDP